MARMALRPALRHAAHRRARASDGDNLLFFDHFTGSVLDTSKWNTSYYWGEDPPRNPNTTEIQIYTPSAVSVSDSRLIITATKDSGSVQNSGAKSPNVVQSLYQADAGSVNWSNPNNVKASDNSRATVTRSNAGTSYYLEAYDFRFNLPDDALPVGFKIEIECSQTAAGAFRFEEVQLSLGSNAVSDDLAASPYTAGYGSPAIPTTEGYITFGGENVTANHTVNVSQINSSDFGFSAIVRRPSGSGSQSVNIDHVRMTVYYVQAAFYSGLITSHNKFYHQYGYIEGRMKLPGGGKGMWPAFWLLQNTPPETWPPEIDIMEAGHDPQIIQVNAHWGTAESRIEDPQVVDMTPTDLSADFHTYALDWQAEYMRWYLDGELVHEITDEDAIPQVPMYLIMNFAIGNSGWSFIGLPDDTSTFPSTFEADYIAWYRRKP
jgi:beta-glucanase (GH16 family)